MNIESIRREALSLPAQERAELAEALFSSLNAIPEEEYEQLWFQEAAKRAAEMDQGRSQRITADCVLREAQALLR
jgi:putative addiction module component (TIGR02574 family)